MWILILPYDQTHSSAFVPMEKKIELTRQELHGIGKGDPDAGPVAERLVVLCNIAATKQLRQGNMSLCFSLLREAEDLTKPASGYIFERRPLLRAVTFNHLAAYYRRRGKPSAALQHALKALKLEEKYKAADNPAGTHLNVCTGLSQLGRHDEALKHARAALRILLQEEESLLHQQFQEQTDKVVRLASSIVIAHHNVAVELSHTQRHASSLEHHQRALDASVRLLGPGHPLSVKMGRLLGRASERGKIKRATTMPVFSCTYTKEEEEGIGVIVDGIASHTQAAPTEAWHEPEQFDDKMSASQIMLHSPQSSRGSTPSLPSRSTLRKKRATSRGGASKAKTTTVTPTLPRLSAAFARSADLYSTPLTRLRHNPLTAPVNPKQVKPQYDSARGKKQQLDNISGKEGKARAKSKPEKIKSVTQLPHLPKSYDQGPYSGRHTQPPLSPLAHPMGGGKHRPSRRLASQPSVPTASGNLSQMLYARPNTAGVATMSGRSQITTKNNFRTNTIESLPVSSGKTSRVKSVVGMTTAASILGPLTMSPQARKEVTSSNSLVSHPIVLSPHPPSRPQTSHITSGRKSKGGQGIPVAPLGRSDDVSEEKVRQLAEEVDIPEKDTCQRAIRLVLAAKQAVRREKAAILIQSSWRGYRVRLLLRREAERVRESMAILIQSQARTFLCKTMLVNQHEAAITIQRVFRGFMARRQIMKERNGANTLVRFWRGRNVRGDIWEKVHAAKIIQSVWTSYLERKRWEEYQEQVMLMQSCVRRWLSFTNIIKRANAAVILQSAFRMHLVRKQYIHLVQSAITIQRVVRGFLVRSKVAPRIRQGASVLCAFGKMIVAKNVYQEQKKAVETIWKYWARMRAIQHSDHIKNAVVKIQSVFRGYLSKNHFISLVNAAYLLQRVIRGHFQRSRLTVQLDAAMVITRIVRGYVARCVQMRRWNAAIVLQKYIRRWLSRKHCDEANHAATVVGCVVRGNYERNVINTKATAVTMASSIWKRICLQRQITIQSQAQTKIASLWKGVCTRRDLKKRHLAATVIQAAVRCHIIRKAYLSRKNSVVKLQGIVKGIRQRDNMKVLTKSSSIVQGVIKGHLVRKHQRKLDNAATVIQSVWRMHRGVNITKNLEQAYHTIGGFIKGIQDRNNMKIRDNAATIIQKNVRGWLDRIHIRREIRACIVIQQCWKRTLLARRKREKEHAVLCFQRMWRGKQGAKQIQLRKKAISILQSNIRGTYVRRRYEKLRNGIAKFEALYLRKHSQDELVDKRESIETIQRVARGFVARLKLKRQIQAAVVLQRQWRFKKLVEEEHRKECAAIVIQREWKKYVNSMWKRELSRAVMYAEGGLMRWIVLVRVKRQLKATCLLQRVWRGHLARKETRERREAAVKIQKLWRGKLAYDSVQKLRAAATTLTATGKQFVIALDSQRRIKAAETVQRYWRGHVDRSKLSTQAKAVAIIQHTYIASRIRQNLHRLSRYAQMLRAVMYVWKDKRDYQTLKVSSVKIQTFYRRMALRRKFIAMQKAAQTIQRVWRASHCVSVERRRQESALKIQKVWRGKLGFNQAQSLKRASVVVRAAVRLFLIQSQLKRENAAALLIQRMWKGHSERKDLASQRTAVSTIKRYFNAYKIKKNIHKLVHVRQMMRAAMNAWKDRKVYVAMKKAAIKIQTCRRRQVDRRNFLSISRVVLSMQRIWRTSKAVRQEEKEANAARLIQTNWRRYRVLRRQSILNKAVLTLQKHRKSCVVKIECEKYRAASQVLVKHMRAAIDRKNLIRAIRSIVVLKSFVRMCEDRFVFLKRRKAVVEIQRVWRGVCVRKSLASLKKVMWVVSLAHKLHKRQCARGWLLTMVRMRQIRKKRAAIVTLQRYTRSMIESKQVRVLNAAATDIQRVSRGYMTRKECEEYKRKVIKAQAIIRGWLAFKRYRHLISGKRVAQSIVHRLLHDSIVKEEENMKAIVDVQKIWRGRQSRIRSKALQDADNQLIDMFQKDSMLYDADGMTTDRKHTEVYDASWCLVKEIYEKAMELGEQGRTVSASKFSASLSKVRKESSNIVTPLELIRRRHARRASLGAGQRVIAVV
ncbi:hypothetical protein ADUPG1_013004, partial [Aduncisulcus paluster]